MTRKNDRGFIALTSVLIIAAVIIVLGVSMFYASLTDQAISTDYQNSQEANFLADFCLKEGVNRLKADINYRGGEEIKGGDKTCYIGLVEDVDGNTKKGSSRGRAGDQPHFATMSEFVHYAIEPGTEGWDGVDDPENSNVRVVSNFLTLTLSQVVEVGTITDTSEDWSASTTAENVDVDNVNLVLGASVPPPPPLGENGTPCNDGSECQSTHCVDGVCCGSDSDTCPTCQACNVSGYEGICYNVTTSCGAETYGCIGSTYFCSGGTCHNGANGQNCSAGGDCCSTYCYVDADGDRYAPSSGTKTCRADSPLGGNGDEFCGR